RLRVQIVQVGEASGGKETFARKADRALDAALLIAAGDRDRSRLKAIPRRQLEQRGMEADRIANAFEHRTLEVVIEALTRDALEEVECLDMTIQETTH